MATKTNKKQNSEKQDSALSFLVSVFTAIDLRIFLARVLKKRYLAILVLIPILSFSAAALLGKMYIKSKWTAKCTLFRNSAGMALPAGMPEIYSPIDIDTVLKTIAKRENIKKVIKLLNLNIPVSSFYRKIDIEKDRNKTLITITATDQSRETAAEIANTLAQVFLESYIKMQKSTATELYNYYKKTDTKLQEEITAMENQLQKYLETNRIISVETEIESKFEQLNEMELKLVDNEMQKKTLEIRLKDIKEQLKGMEDSIPVSFFVEAGGKELSQKRRELSILRKKYTDENPKVARILAEIEQLEAEEHNKKDQKPIPAQITYGNNMQKDEMESEMSSIRSSLTSISDNIRSLKNSVSVTNKRLEELAKIKTIEAQLNRKIEVNHELQQKIKEIMSMSEIVSANDLSDIKILERAIPPVFPEGTMKKVLAIAGGFIGFVIAVLLVFLPELLDFSVKSGYEISKILGTKNIGLIPNKDQVEPSDFYEAVQIYIEWVDKLTENFEKPVVSMCSSMVETGKSFISGFLIDVLVKKKKKILYLESLGESEAELKNYTVNDFLYHSESKDSLPETSKINEYLDKLYFELNFDTYKYPLDKSRLKLMISELQKKYDFIIIEMFLFRKNRPLFAIFTELCNMNILVSKFKHSNKFSNKTLTKFISEQGAKNIVSVVNNVDKYYYRFIK